jgi:hypothetical protein
VLTQLIVSTYKSIAELALWVLIVIGGLVGLGMGKAIGWPMFGLFAGAVGTFLFLAIVLGAALLIADLHTIVKAIDRKLEGGASSNRDGGTGSESSTSNAGSLTMPMPNLDRHAKAAKLMASDGYHEAEIIEALEREGLGKSDAESLAKHATSGSRPAKAPEAAAASEDQPQRAVAAPKAAATPGTRSLARFCRECGQAQEPGGKFCGHCGAAAA